MTIKRATTIIQQPTFALATQWLSIVTKWTMLIVFIWKIGVLTEKYSTKFTKYDGYSARMDTLSQNFYTAQKLQNVFNESLISTMPEEQQALFTNQYAILSNKY